MEKEKDIEFFHIGFKEISDCTHLKKKKKKSWDFRLAKTGVDGLEIIKKNTSQ